MIDDGEERLLSEFGSSSMAEWRALVEAQLKGVPFEKKLVTHTVENVDLHPIYTSQDIENLPYLAAFPGQWPFVRGFTAEGHARQGWKILEFLPYSTPQEVLRAAQVDLPRGLSGIELAVDRATRAGLDPAAVQLDEVGACGTSITSADDLTELLTLLATNRWQIHLEAGMAVVPVAALLVAAANGAGIALDGSITGDPYASLAVEGSPPFAIPTFFDQLAGLVEWSIDHAPRVRTVGVDLRNYKDAGANCVQEVGLALAHVAGMLRELNERGISPSDASSKLMIRVGVGSNFFMEISKIRALRFVLASLLDHLKVPKEEQRITIFGSTARWNKTKFAPYNNVLRATSETFAAIAGGCDCFTALPFDEQAGLADEPARRLARNTQIILKEETKAHSVIDAAGGSWYVETLTHQLAEKGWAFFQQIENEGGILQALQSGSVQGKIELTAKERIARLGQRHFVAVGSNMYVKLDEELPVRPLPNYAQIKMDRSQEIADRRLKSGEGAAEALERIKGAGVRSPDTFQDLIAAAHAGATVGDLAGVLNSVFGTPLTVTPLKLRRLTSDYERLRNSATRWIAKHGRPPAAFLIQMGPAKQHKARADFSRAFLEPGGFEVTAPPKGCESVEEAVRLTKAANPLVAVICSTDETYPDLVPALAAALKGALPHLHLIVAGLLPEHTAAFIEAGVNDFIHLKAGNLEKLTELHKILGITL